MNAGFVAVLAVAAAAMVFIGAPRAREAGERFSLEKRWFYLPANLAADANAAKADSIMRLASAAGYNGVLFSDTKTFMRLEPAHFERWRGNAAKIRKLASDLGLEFVVCVFPFGYGETYLGHDPNLAAGLPVRNAPLVRRGGLLVPEQTAAVENGAFERYRGNRLEGFDLQDNPGKGSFIDTEVFKEGRASIRFEDVGSANRHGHGRLFQKVAVEPYQQYRVRVWMRAERLTAGMVQIIVLAGEKALQFQSLAIRSPEGFASISSAKSLTTDWVEQSVAFNSLGEKSVVVGIGVWGGSTGTIWWDDLRVDAAPTLNLLRRDTAPLSIEDEGGAAFTEGEDFERVADPGLGKHRWPGTYDTRHEPPVIHVPAGSRIREGERVRLTCYHTPIFHGGQVCCTLDDPKVFELAREEIRRVREALSPDGYFMSHDEIRCAGWEPSQVENFRTAGELFAYNIERCREIAQAEGGGKPLYVWSDMYDPNHNAHGDYYLVRGTIAKSWEGLRPDVVVVKWGKPEQGGASLKFFGQRGHKLMVAAFYDEDVEAEHDLWMKGGAGSAGIIGVMYTTWRGDYSKLEEFAKVWWGR